MARSDWSALVTEAQAEYAAATDLERLGLRPYLPQAKRRWQPPYSTAPTVKLYPLFPRYLLIPFGEASSPLIRLARGLRKVRPVLADDEGRPWRCPGDVVDRILQAEAEGMFDEMLMKPGDRVTIRNGPLAGVETVLQELAGTRAQLFVQLLGGARVRVAAAKVVRA